VLPIESQSRSCDVCTVTEAREVMIRLGETIKRPVEEVLKTAGPPPPPPRPRRAWPPYAGLGGGLAAMMAGAITFFAADGGKGLPALGGGLIGAGLVVSTASVYLIVLDPNRKPASPKTPIHAPVGVAFRW
jgi:hypothetical protein